eukprot:SAG22_NODE_1978_length_3212_cov_3.220045_5_plen_118_part_00
MCFPCLAKPSLVHPLELYGLRQCLTFPSVCPHQADYFALSSAGVLKPDDADEEWVSADQGGVLQIFETSAEWLQDDNEMETPFDEVEFVNKHRRFELKVGMAGETCCHLLALPLHSY